MAWIILLIALKEAYGLFFCEKFSSSLLRTTTGAQSLAEASGIGETYIFCWVLAPNAKIRRKVVPKKKEQNSGNPKIKTNFLVKDDWGNRPELYPVACKTAPHV
jgi:hypothetical protein